MRRPVALNREMERPPVARKRVNRPHGKNSNYDWIKAEAVLGSRRPGSWSRCAAGRSDPSAAAVTADDECLVDEAAQMLAAADRSRVLFGVRWDTAPATPTRKISCERDKSSLDHGFGRAARHARAALLSASMNDVLAFVYRAGSGRVAATAPCTRLRRRRRVRSSVSVNARTRDTRASRARADRGPRSPLRATHGGCRWP